MSEITVTTELKTLEGLFHCLFTDSKDDGEPPHIQRRAMMRFVRELLESQLVLDYFLNLIELEIDEVTNRHLDSAVEELMETTKSFLDEYEFVAVVPCNIDGLVIVVLTRKPN